MVWAIAKIQPECADRERFDTGMGELISDGDSDRSRRQVDTGAGVRYVDEEF